MVDWNGLFKWSMKYQDENSQKDVKPMDPETYKWLSEALEEYTYDEAKRMKAICDDLLKPEKATKQDEDERFELLDELQELVEGIENARVLNQIGGFPILMNVMFHSQYQSNRLSAYLTFLSCNQNNAVIQQAAIENKGFHLVNIILNKEKYDVKEREHALSALSSMVRGEFLEGKRQFIEADGVELLSKLMQESDSRKLKLKTILFLKDLVLYDDRLHLTINNTENYANTNAKNTDKGLSVHKENKQMKEVDNELPQNKKYKGIVKQKLKEIQFVEKISESLLGDQEDNKIDQREALCTIILELVKGDPQFMGKQLQFLDQYKKHFATILTLNQKNEGLNEFEIQTFKELLILLQMFQKNIPQELYEKQKEKEQKEKEKQK